MKSSQDADGWRLNESLAGKLITPCFAWHVQFSLSHQCLWANRESFRCHDYLDAFCAEADSVYDWRRHVSPIMLRSFVLLFGVQTFNQIKTARGLGVGIKLWMSDLFVHLSITSFNHNSGRTDRPWRPLLSICGPFRSRNMGRIHVGDFSLKVLKDV